MFISKKYFAKFCYTVVLLAVGLHSACAQNLLKRNWYFGDANKLGIQFDRPNYKAALVGRPNITPYGKGGGVVVTNPFNGNLLFYSDGANVYDANHSIMGNGAGLVGDGSRNQAAVACKKPGATSLYYLFVSDATGSIQYYTVDMSVGGVFPSPPTGQLTSNTPTAVPSLPSNLSEAMIIVPHANGEDFWLINHTSNSTTYYTTPITAAGPGASIATSTGLIQNPYNFAYNDSLQLISVSPKDANRNIEFVKFDNSGMSPAPITFLKTIRGSAVNSNQAIYDTEWSKNNQYLYVSVHGATPTVQPDLLQFNLNDTTALPVSILTNTIQTSLGLQMAPDSAIYHLYEKTTGVFVVGKILNTDSAANKVIYKPDAFKKGGSSINYNAFQFPSFAGKDSILIKLSFVPVDTCSNSPTSFFPTVEPGADSIRWDFGDKSSGNGWNPSHTYTAGGTFTVKATAFLDGDSAVYTRDVTIKQFNLQINLVQDTTACSSELPVPKDHTKQGCKTSGSQCFQVKASFSGGTPSSILWYGPPPDSLTTQVTNSSNSSTLSPDSAGFYYVVAKDATTGCEAYAGVNIKEYGVPDMRANIWHFGQNAGIDFNPLFRNPSKPALSIPGPLNTIEGCADICDQNGQIIFSTDGQNLFDRKKKDITPSPNPPGLGGTPNATQSALIVPMPNDPTLYYIFTTQPVDDPASAFELRYSLFDLKHNNGDGAVVKSNQLLFSRSTERLASAGNWLIAHEFGNDAFYAYPITATGIGDPVITNIGSVHSFSSANTGKGYMKFNSGNTLAVALSNGSTNVIELFDFNTTTGVLSKYRVANTNINTGEIYGLEFNGSKLFATIVDSPAPNSSQLVEFYLDSLNIPHLITPPPAPYNEELGAMQLGPDGKVYVAVNGKPLLGVLNPNSDSTKTSTIDVTNGFPLTTGLSQLGLPNFIQTLGNQLQGPSLSVSGSCLGDSISFSGSGTDVIDTLAWFFGDGSSVKGVNKTQASHVYTSPGTYTVRLRISNRCVGFIKELTQVIQIFPYPANPSKAIPLCSPSVTLDANPSAVPNLTYLWTTTDTTRTITVSSYGSYGVTVTNAGGCTTNGNMRVYSPLPNPINLGQDSVVCSAPSAKKILDTQLNFANAHKWFVNGVANGNTSKMQTVDLSIPGTYKYKVVFTDPSNGCQSSDSVTYVVQQSPVFTTSTTDPTACASGDGKVSIKITAPSAAADIYSYAITPGGGQNTINFNTPTIAGGLSGGTYTVTVTDQINSCPTSKIVTLNGNPAFSVQPSVVGTCDPNIKIFIHTSVSIATPIAYRIINSSTNKVVDSGTLPASENLTLKNIPSGSSYYVEVTTGSCTNVSNALPVNSSAKVAVSFDLSNVCNGQLTAVAAGGTSFDWSASQTGSLVNPTTNSATVNLNSGTSLWRIRVTATDGTNCPGVDSVDVAYDNIVPDFTASTCRTPVILTASPIGSYLYDWRFNSTAIPGGNTLELTDASQSGQYELYVTSTLTGCPAAGPANHTIDVNELSKLAVVITPPSNACKNSTFLLTSTVNHSANTYQWIFNGSNIPNSNSSSWSDNREGTYEVVVTDVNNCQATSTSVPVTYSPTVPTYLQPTGIVCPDDGSVYNLTPGLAPDDFQSYRWFLNGKAESQYDDKPTYPAKAGGLYHVDLVDKYGCKESDETNVIATCKPDIEGPTAFHPGSSIDQNNFFQLFNKHVSSEDFQIFIFNRWGEMVYQNTDLYFQWNGKDITNTTLLPPGVYGWVAKFKGDSPQESEIREKHGGVVLLR